LLENVTGHLSLGFGRVLGDLAESGYDVRWDCIPAAAIGAPHRRDRVFILANANDNGFVAAQKRNGAVQRSDTSSTREEATQQFTRRSCKPGGLGKNSAATLADATSRASGQSQPHRIPSANRTAEPGERSCISRSISDWWQTEPDVGRVAHGVPNRVDRLRGLGNAVVPQVVEWIARTWLPLR
jgi:DNA (cytosine-5)-methyltransferase 1